MLVDKIDYCFPKCVNITLIIFTKYLYVIDCKVIYIFSSSDNLMYIKFVRGITDEVLRKGIFTNKALKKIFQCHIDSHKQYLNLVSYFYMF